LSASNEMSRPKAAHNGNCGVGPQQLPFFGQPYPTQPGARARSIPMWQAALLV